MKDKNKISENNNENSADISLNLEGSVEKKKVKKWPFIVAAIVVVIALATVLLWKPISKLFSKPQEQQVPSIQELERKAMTKLIDGFIEDYNALISTGDDTVKGRKCHVEFDVNENALNLLKLMGTDLTDFAALNDVTVDSYFENDGKRLRIYMEPNHENADLPAGELVYDRDSGHLYFSPKSLSDQYLDFDTSEFTSADRVLALISHLPSADALEPLMKEYLEDFLALMVLKGETKKTVQVEEVTQECTVYEVQINLQDFCKLNMDYLDKLNALFGEETEFNTLVTDIKDSIASYSETCDKDQVINWTDFVSADGKIVGRRINTSTNEQWLDYLCVRNGDNIAVDFTLFNVEFNGSGTCKNDELNGKFALYVDGVKYLEVNPDNVSLDELEKGEIKGTVGIVPSDEFFELFFGFTPPLKIALDVEFIIKDDARMIVIKYMDYASVSLYITDYTPETIQLPEGTAIDGSDTDALNRWLESIDMEKLKIELEKAGISFWE